MIASLCGIVLVSCAATHAGSPASIDGVQSGPVFPSIDPNVVPGITAPRRVATLAPVYPGGRIQTINVEEGQAVHAGDLLVLLDDRAQRVRAEIAKAQAESTLEIELARAKWEQARYEQNRLASLHDEDFAASKELRDARFETQKRRLEHEIAEFAHVQAQQAYERERILLDLMNIRAPFDGFVSEITANVGETVDDREAIVTFVQIDPLEVVLDCPLLIAHRFRVGAPVTVHSFDPRWGERLGTVSYAAMAADAASQTLRVKLRVPNSDAKWIAGLKVYVDLDEAKNPPGDSLSKTDTRSRPVDPERH